ncbi:MAG: hypothetical protein M3Q56_03940 [Bacteroidota bacterium]|nr:hypothetical protein [Bacteroidota bacterium]
MRVNKILILVLICTALISCRKDKTDEDPIIDPPPPKVYVEREIPGQVLTPEREVITFLPIQIDRNSLKSDVNGHFFYRGLVGEDRFVIKTNSPSDFTAFYAEKAGEYGSPFIKLIMHPLKGVKTINGNLGGRVPFANGGFIEIPASAVSDFNNNSIVDDVQVYVRYIDPTDPESYLSIPSNMLSRTESTELKSISSFGMIQIVLRDRQNRNLRWSKPVKIKLPVPSSLIRKMPSIIHTWHLDENSALWVKDSLAQTENATYTFISDHHGILATGLLEGVVELKGSIKLNNNQYRSELLISDESLGITIPMSTDGNGHFSTYLIKGHEYRLLLNIECGLNVYNKPLGIIHNVTDLGVLNVLSEKIAFIRGAVYDCNKAPVKNGYVIINNKDKRTSQIVRLNGSGRFESQVNICTSNLLEVIPIDERNQEVYNKYYFLSKENISTDSMFACSQKINESLLSFQMKDKTHTINNCTVRDTIMQGRQTLIFESVDAFNITDIVRYKLILIKINNSDYKLEFSRTGGSIITSFIIEGVECAELSPLVLGKNKGEAVVFSLRACEIAIVGQSQKSPGVIRIQSMIN